MNSSILSDAEDLQKCFKELIELNPHKKEDFRAGNGEGVVILFQESTKSNMEDAGG